MTIELVGLATMTAELRPPLVLSGRRQAIA